MNARALTRLRHPSMWMPQGLAWLGCIAVAWVALSVEYMLLVTWPWPTLTGTALVVGFAAGGVVCVHLQGLALEPVQERKDIAVDAAMGIAFSAQELEQRISGEHDAIDPEPESWALDGTVEPRRYPARCEWCGRPATQFTENGPRCGTCPDGDRPYADASKVRLT